MATRLCECRAGSCTALTLLRLFYGLHRSPHPPVRMTGPEDDGRTAQVPATERPRSRVLDAGGIYWRVYERAYSVMDRRTGTCLVFEAEGIIRRVRTFPADWYLLGDDALYALSLGA